MKLQNNKEEKAPCEAGQKPPFVARRDIFIIGGILLAAALIWLFIFFTRKDGATAVVTVITTADGTVTQHIPLDEDNVYYLDSASLPVQLEVNGGSIRFINSVCPDHDCEGFGALRHDGEWAACLPAGVSVQVQED